jgi:hypothetical protein
VDEILENFNLLQPNPNDEVCLARAEGSIVAAYENAAWALKFFGDATRATYFANLAKTGIKAYCGTETSYNPTSLVEIVDSFGGQVFVGAARDAASATTQRRVALLNRAPNSSAASRPAQIVDAPAPPRFNGGRGGGRGRGGYHDQGHGPGAHQGRRRPRPASTEPHANSK